jgi:hypothetical protein
MKSPLAGPSRQFLRIVFSFLLGAVLLWLGGCAKADGVPRNMEADYGRAVTSNRLQMMVKPPGEVDPNPPVGLPPQTAKNVQEHYDKTFKEKEEPPTIRWIFK